MGKEMNIIAPPPNNELKLSKIKDLIDGKLIYNDKEEKYTSDDKEETIKVLDKFELMNNVKSGNTTPDNTTSNDNTLINSENHSITNGDMSNDLTNSLSLSTMDEAAKLDMNSLYEWNSNNQSLACNKIITCIDDCPYKSDLKYNVVETTESIGNILSINRLNNKICKLERTVMITTRFITIMAVAIPAAYISIKTFNYIRG